MRQNTDMFCLKVAIQTNQTSRIWKKFMVKRTLLLKFKLGCSVRLGSNCFW